MFKILRRFVTRNSAFSGDVIVFHKYRAAYFAIPKVANSSLKGVSADVLRDEIDEQFINDNWKPFPFRNKEGRKFLKEKRILVTSFNAEEDSYWKFTIVRNPWDRLISCYSQKIISKDKDGKLATDDKFFNGICRTMLKQYGTGFGKAMSFVDFVDFVADISDAESNPHFRSQHTFVADRNGQLLVDYVGRFENMTEEFPYIKKQCGFPDNIVMPHLLKSQRQADNTYQTDASYAKVRKRYHVDFSIFGY